MRLGLRSGSRCGIGIIRANARACGLISPGSGNDTISGPNLLTAPTAP